MAKKAYMTHRPEEAPKTTEAEEIEEHIGIKPEEVMTEWKAREFVQYSRPKSWYTLLLAIAGILVVYSIIVANYLFTIIIVMLAIIINTLTRKEPQLINVAITTKGIKINEKLYTFDEDLASFWILYNPPDLKTLNFSRQQRFLPEITIQLESQNPLKIRELLLDHLTEDVEKEEHAADKVARRFGF
jgi:hypothetical protein